jgi:hypothetical protein
MGVIAGILIAALALQPPPPPDPPPAPVELGNRAFTLGDSQMDGRAPELAAKGSMHAFRTIWNSTFTAFTSFTINGAGGESLEETQGRYNAAGARTTATWVHFQESGNQDQDGQRTAEEFGATFDAFVADILLNTSTTVISTETAFSFGRTISYRVWDTYNTKLKERVAYWATQGVTIYVGEVDRNIKALQERSGVTAADVWYQDPDARGPAYHYTELGNLMVALTNYAALGYDVTTLDLSGITTVTTTMKNHCLAVIAEFA